MELRSQTNAGSTETTVQQYLVGPDQMLVEVLGGAFDFSASHGHSHWQNFALYEIWSVMPNGELNRLMADADKVGFCLLDLKPASGVWLTLNVRTDFDIAESPEYTSCENDRQGISVGWIDTYEAHLAGQVLDIEALNDGVYALRSTIDPAGVFKEADSENNAAMVYFLLHDDEVCVIGEEFSLLDRCDLPSR
jgi:hypothetical protein